MKMSSWCPTRSLNGHKWEKPFQNFKFNYFLPQMRKFDKFEPLKPFKFSVIRFSIFLLFLLTVQEKTRESREATWYLFKVVIASDVESFSSYNSFKNSNKISLFIRIPWGKHLWSTLWSSWEKVKWNVHGKIFSMEMNTRERPFYDHACWLLLKARKHVIIFRHLQMLDVIHKPPWRYCVINPKKVYFISRDKRDNEISVSGI